MQIQLFKKTGTYTDKDGKEKRFVNFYLKCGDALVPIECTVLWLITIPF